MIKKYQGGIEWVSIKVDPGSSNFRGGTKMTDNFYVVTNNPLFFESEFRTFRTFRTEVVNGSFEGVLLKVRDMIHQGHELISHPLGASIRMMYSPYRSVLVGEKTDKMNSFYVEVIEGSIETYRKNTGHRNIDLKNEKDYALIDQHLLMEAVKEHENLKKA